MKMLSFSLWQNLLNLSNFNEDEIKKRRKQMKNDLDRQKEAKKEKKLK